MTSRSAQILSSPQASVAEAVRETQPPYGFVCPAGRSTPLAALVRALDRACDSRPQLRAMQLQVALAAASHEALLEQEVKCGSDTHYRRHLLYADPLDRYAVVSLVWQPGQRTPVHGHHVWCAFTVIEGTLEETWFSRVGQSRAALAKQSANRTAGFVSYTDAGDSGIHRLANVSAQPAISLHVYGVAGAQVSTAVNDVFEG